MAYEFKADSGFRMLHADRHSRPISHCAAVQNPMPSQATVAAVDQNGRALFLAPETEAYGPERNMYTAVQYSLGQAPAGIAQGNLRQRSGDDEGDAEPSQLSSSYSSCSVDQDRLHLSSSALPAIGADPRGLTQGAGGEFAAVSSVDPPQTTGRLQGGKHT